MTNFGKKCVKGLQLISVEPSMWLYMMAFSTTSVVEPAFFRYKACIADHGLSEEICRNLTANTALNKEVQATVSKFLLWNPIASYGLPVILAFFTGNWSDRRGRKLLLILGLFGKFIYSFMIVVNSLIPSWSVYTIVYTASFPSTLFGADVAIFASCFAYITDITSVEERTMRVSILDAIYLSAIPIGTALGSYLFNHVVNFSYTIMFTINSSMLLLAILYSFVNLQWQTNSQQEPLRGVNFFSDFFDIKHVKATIKTLTKRRDSSGRLFLWFLLVGIMLYAFQRAEKHITYYYAQVKFQWNDEQYGDFRTFQSIFFVLAMFLGVPIMNKSLKMKDTVIVSIGTISHIGARIIFFLANVPKLFYVATIVGALGPCVAPILRSMISKEVTTEERGKIFSMLSVFDNAAYLLSGVLYSQLYYATLSTMPNVFYFLTVGTQFAVFLLILIIHFSPGMQQYDNESHPNEPPLSRISSEEKLDNT